MRHTYSCQNYFKPTSKCTTWVNNSKDVQPHLLKLKTDWYPCSPLSLLKHTHTHKYAHLHACICTSAHTHTQRHACQHTHTHTHTVHTNTHYAHLHACICTSARTHTHTHAHKQYAHLHACICMRAYTHTHTNTQTCTLTQTQTHHMPHTHTHTHRHTHTQKHTSYATPVDRMQHGAVLSPEQTWGERSKTNQWMWPLWNSVLTPSRKQRVMCDVQVATSAFPACYHCRCAGTSPIGTWIWAASLA